MPTFNYSFDKLYGPGTTCSIDLVAGTTYTFDITNNTGSSYFVLERGIAPFLKPTRLPRRDRQIVRIRRGTISKFLRPPKRLGERLVDLRRRGVAWRWVPI